MAGTFGLKGYEVYKAYSTEECLNKVNELDGKVDIIFVDGKIAADRSAMLIIKVKRINSNIKLWFLPKTRLIKQGFWSMVLMKSGAKPISAETIVDKVYSLLLTREPKVVFNSRVR